MSEACQEAGMAFGILTLSPWGSARRSYGTDRPITRCMWVNSQIIDAVWCEIAEVWLDGANGEGPNGKRQFYDWLKDIINRFGNLQSDAVIAVCGPDVRWIEMKPAHKAE